MPAKMAARERKKRAALWQERARDSHDAAWLLYEAASFHAAANRVYYAAYQAATSVSILHSDFDQFPSGWNNPSHDQLPDLIRNNGDLSVSARRVVAAHLLALRRLREDADYRIGITVNQQTVSDAMQLMEGIFSLLGTDERD